MYATMRRIKTLPGLVPELAKRIETEYVPLARSIPGFVSYYLVDLGEDEVGSVGIFSDQAGADAGNAAAADWTRATLGPLIASPLDARAGTLLVAATTD